jgi:hypothetical protein
VANIIDGKTEVEPKRTTFIQNNKVKIDQEYNWQKIADENGLDISISGIPSLSTYSFNHEDALKYKTFITQEMLKRGFLASTNFYASTAHEDVYFDSYFDNLNEVYKTIAECVQGNTDINTLLEGPVCHSGFKRLN